MLAVSPTLPEPIRYATYERDGYTCQDCQRPGRPGYGQQDLQAHHIVPLLDGGTHALDNLMTLCGRCHTRREMPIRNARFARERATQREWEAMTVAQAAIAIGVTRQTIIHYIKTKRLPARKLGQAYLIPREALRDFSPPHGGWPRGRPRKPKEGPTDDR